MNPSSPEAVVQRQLDAYNARDIDAFMATYAPDAQIFDHPATLLAEGSEKIRERYAGRFREQNLYATLVHRIVMGNKVLDQECITRTFPEGAGTLKMVAIYEVNDGLISKAWFIAGTKTLDNKR